MYVCIYIYYVYIYIYIYILTVMKQFLHLFTTVPGHLKGSTNKAAQSSADNRSKIVLRSLVNVGSTDQGLDAQLMDA